MLSCAHVCWRLSVMVFAATENRVVGATGLNANSSRSHCVTTVTVERREEESGTVRIGKLSLVDLAGSEMVRKTKATGLNLEEAKIINKSLSSLGNVIKALAPQSSVDADTASVGRFSLATEDDTSSEMGSPARRSTARGGGGGVWVDEDHSDDEETAAAPSRNVGLSRSESRSSVSSLGKTHTPVRSRRRSIASVASSGKGGLGGWRSPSGPRHVPYRDSKLTRLLQDSLGGNCRTALVICCSGNVRHASETLSTLRFGSRASRVQNFAVVNKVHTAEEMAAQLTKAEAAIDAQSTLIRQLKAQLMRVTRLATQLNEMRATAPDGESVGSSAVEDRGLVVELAETRTRELELRQEVRQLQSENASLKEENQSLSSALSARETDIVDLQRRLSKSETALRLAKKELQETAVKPASVDPRAAAEARKAEVSRLARQLVRRAVETAFKKLPGNVRSLDDARVLVQSLSFDLEESKRHQASLASEVDRLSVAAAAAEAAASADRTVLSDELAGAQWRALETEAELRRVRGDLHSMRLASGESSLADVGPFETVGGVSETWGDSDGLFVEGDVVDRMGDSDDDDDLLSGGRCEWLGPGCDLLHLWHRSSAGQRVAAVAERVLSVGGDVIHTTAAPIRELRTAIRKRLSPQSRSAVANAIAQETAILRELERSAEVSDDVLRVWTGMVVNAPEAPRFGECWSSHPAVGAPIPEVLPDHHSVVTRDRSTMSVPREGVLALSTEEMESVRCTLEQYEEAVSLANRRLRSLSAVNRQLMRKFAVVDSERGELEGAVRSRERHIASLEQELRDTIHRLRDAEERAGPLEEDMLARSNRGSRAVTPDDDRDRMLLDSAYPDSRTTTPRVGGEPFEETGHDTHLIKPIAGGAASHMVRAVSFSQTSREWKSPSSQRRDGQAWTTVIRSNRPSSNGGGRSAGWISEDD
jgi:PIN domain nuclease of toxin-antitoxin system